MAYRGFVDFWPKLVAGQVRLGASVITGQWLRSPGLAGSYELLRWHETTVFDSFAQDAASNVFPNIRHTLQRNFLNAALSTTFLVEGEKRTSSGPWPVRGSSTTSPRTPAHRFRRMRTSFRLYSELVCSVPFMAVTVQQVLIP